MIPIDWAAALAGLRHADIMRLTADFAAGRCYATVAHYSGGRGGTEKARMLPIRKLRGAGAGRLFKPGARRGFPRYWDAQAGCWVVDLADVADWCVRRWRLTTPAAAAWWADQIGGWDAFAVKILERAAEALPESETDNG